ncbi:DUF5839 family protein [Lysinibacillus sphaericus]
MVVVGKVKSPFLVAEVFQEELEDTGKRYKRIIGVLEKAPVKN